MILYQAIHLTKKIANRKVEMDNLRTKKGESDLEVIQLGVEVKQLSYRNMQVMDMLFRSMTPDSN
ncbi:hypothetical protein [Ammoniphilus sp. 3BR4]|uniref:hypothetical protein n=1 Tax=Ammoniphilus sp. 3BR4 TaxID=3158265 RepID=UPI0034656058